MHYQIRTLNYALFLKIVKIITVHELFFQNTADNLLNFFKNFLDEIVCLQAKDYNVMSYGVFLSPKNLSLKLSLVISSYLMTAPML